MIKYLIILLVFPFSVKAQISFIKQHATNIALDEVNSPIELSNGNFACSVINHSSWYNAIYLFSKCGEVITTLQISTPGEEYVYINNLTEVSTGDLLATGYGTDSTNNAYYLLLDPNTLEVKEERKYFSYLYTGIGKTIEENGVLFQMGGILGLTSTSINLNLRRNVHLLREFDGIEYPGLLSYRFIGSTLNRGYLLETYNDAESERNYSTIRCVDGKLRDLYFVIEKNDTTFTSIKPAILFTGGDTIILGVTEYNTNSNSNREFFRKYHRNTLVFQNEVFNEDQFYESGRCLYHSGLIKCVQSNGEITWFNTKGEQTFHSTSLTTVSGIRLSGANISMDGGFFAINKGYGMIDGVSQPVLHFVKTTGDYEITPKPSPECLVNTESLRNELSIAIFPNPAVGLIHVRSSDPVLCYKIFDSRATLLNEGQGFGEEIDIELNLLPGMYIILLETRKGMVSKKLFVVR